VVAVAGEGGRKRDGSCSCPGRLVLSQTELCSNSLAKGA
jgi:hypothetical protein